MRVSEQIEPRMPPPVRALVRILLAGMLAALLVLAGGWLVARLMLGADDERARARVEAEARTAFAGMAAALREDADAIGDAELVRAAAGDDTDAARRLFVAASEVIANDEEAVDDAVTVFGADGAPIAWAGRPSEIPPERLRGGETWFVSRLVLGPRLVYVRPLTLGATRVGTIAAERALVPSEQLAGAASAALRGAEVAMTFPTTPGIATLYLPGEDVPSTPDTSTFTLESPSGGPLLTATVTGADLRATRDRWQRATRSIALLVLAGTVVLLAGPLLDWRNRVRRPADYAVATILTAAIIVIARVIARVASLADWSSRPVLSAVDYSGTLLQSLPLFTSPFDFLLTTVAAGALVALALFAIEAWRLRSWRRRHRLTDAWRWTVYLAIQAAAGALVAATLLGHEALLRNTIENSTVDLLRFSLQQWNLAIGALQLGLIVAHATALGLAVAILRAALARWLLGRGDWPALGATMAAWLLPVLVWRAAEQRPIADLLPLFAAAAAAALLALNGARLGARYRHGSQAFRLTLLTLGLIVPAAAFYPTIFQLAWKAKSQLVETTYAPQALNQRQSVLAALKMSQQQIDEIDNLAALAVPTTDIEATTDRAYRVWQVTALANYPVTSSVEILAPDGRLVSRFAFNLAEGPTTAPQSQEVNCEWETFEEVNRFFAEERRILHASRQICGEDGTPLGSIVIHAMPADYENLPFIPSRSPYVELVRAPDPQQREGSVGRDVEYAVYGWSRTPLYTSADTAWPLPDETFARTVQSREPFWDELRRGSTRYDVYVLNDRGGIYALGFPVLSALDHLVHLAELTILAVLAYLLLLAGNAIFAALSRRRVTAPALLREIRASFYRKLFIAFVAAVFIPVVALALVTRLYVADRMRTDIEQEAVRTASEAGRVVQDLAPRASAERVVVDDDLLVWVSRLVDQDVNMFSAGRLVATSERNLFASRFLPPRTPAEVHHALQLRREASIVIRERVGTLNPYLVAGTRLFEQGILTVPLAARQQEIEDEIETLDRRVLLAAMLFMLAGAGLGYSMAERISDPVNRLTRATRRIARGDLDARIAATSSDELRRLVEDFNSMARDLQRQRAELERTNRLEAWAEMARQVAHEIKNPLTPIQLNAEHLRRVHADRGEPLGPILQQCVDTILTQVRILRQIASEFSSFAASPTVRLSSVHVPDLLREVVDPYRAGLADRIRFDVDVPETLPPVSIDRTLISRSLTNIVENALHAMPGTGTLSIEARHENRHVRIRVADTGVGMDPDALARAFEPYFSTKSTGTGLGLPIAKRNVELMGGAIAVSSERDRGTAVELSVPVAADETN